MRATLSSFWRWYDRNERWALLLAAGLFGLQSIHLLWLTLDVVAPAILDFSVFPTTPFNQFLLALVDYLEVPAILVTSVVYGRELRRGMNHAAVRYLLLINAQWLHLFWITDEFIIEQLTGGPRMTVLPLWLAGLAIIIDYLEIPVITDTGSKVFREFHRTGSTDR